MAIFYLDSGSIRDLDVTRLRATGSLFGSASFAVSASWAPGGSGQINVSAGTTSNNVSQLVFSNANNINFGLNGSTITATYNPAVQSFWELAPAIQGNSTSNFNTAANLVQPFILPYDISISFIRVPINFSYATTGIATTANTSIQFRQTQTYYANFYSAGSGASSKSLQHFAQASISLVYAASATEGNNSNAQTNAFLFTWYSEGQTTSTNVTTITVPASSVFNFTTNVLSNFTATKMIDIPFATSLARGDYYVAFQRSSATATTGVAALSNVSINNQYAYMSQANISGFGVPTNNSTIFQQQPGVGSWSATNQGGTTNSIAFSQINTISGQPRIPFQFQRFA